jgi:hypothetical protein
MSPKLPYVQRALRHPDVADLGFMCSCGHRTRSQLNAWAQYDSSGEDWSEMCEACGKTWHFHLEAESVDEP